MRQTSLLIWGATLFFLPDLRQINWGAGIVSTDPWTLVCCPCEPLHYRPQHDPFHPVRSTNTWQRTLLDTFSPHTSDDVWPSSSEQSLKRCRDSAFYCLIAWNLYTKGWNCTLSKAFSSSVNNTCASPKISSVLKGKNITLCLFSHNYLLPNPLIYLLFIIPKKKTKTKRRREIWKQPIMMAFFDCRAHQPFHPFQTGLNRSRVTPLVTVEANPGC